MTIDDLKKLSLNQVEEQYRYGTISESLTLEYIGIWNRGPHLTDAYLMDGFIRQRDKD